MRLDRNKEGYHDPTAGDALVRVVRDKRREKYKALTYRLREVKGFPVKVERV